VREIRATKEPDEISLIRRSIGLTKQAIDGSFRRIGMKGMTEDRMSREIEIFFLRRGGRPAFDPIVACDAGASAPWCATTRSSKTLGGPESPANSEGVETESSTPGGAADARSRR